LCLTPPAPPSTLFPYTTLFRSHPPPPDVGQGGNAEDGGEGRAETAVREPTGPSEGGHGKVLVPAGTDEGEGGREATGVAGTGAGDRKSTRLNSSHVKSSYAVFC